MRRLAVLLTLVLCSCSLGHSPARPSGSPSPTFGPQGAGPVLSAVAGSPPTAGQPWFLTIGDSITAGYSRDPARIGKNSGWPVQMEALLARSQRPWHLYDVACPGETSESYRTQCSGRAKIPFLEHSSQHDVAMAAITAHLADLQLIVVDLGSNDLLLPLLHGTPLSEAVTNLKSRLDAIVAELRKAAPKVPLLLANLYDPFENGSPETLQIADMANAAVTEVAQHNGAILVDLFSAINTRTAPAPNLCLYLDCGHFDPVHPTVAGHVRIAIAVASAVP